MEGIPADPHPSFVGVRSVSRFLLTPFDKVQLAYLKALQVHQTAFTEVLPAPGSIGARSP
jgi:hypothetical protein